jgi:outer membrane protein TolC
VAERRTIGLAAARAWIAAASASHALAAENESLRTARAHAAFVRLRVSAGAAASLDEVRANKEVAVASALVERARAARLRAQERLGLLSGERHPLDADVRDDEPLSSASRGSDLPVPEEVAAHLALETAANETRNMYTDYLPSLHLELLGFHQNHPQPILPVTGTGYAAFLRLTVPLFEAEREAKLHERRAEQRRAEAHLEDVTRTVAVEKRDAASDVVRLKAALEETVRAAELAHAALVLSQGRYERGAGTQLDVIYAIREARDADIAVAAAEDVWRRAALELLAARGRLPSYEQLRDHRRRDH